MICKYIGHEQSVQSIDVCPNDDLNMFISGSNDKMLKLWNIFAFDNVNNENNSSKKRKITKSIKSTKSMVNFF